MIPITEPPVVEIDTEATAAYVRLREAPVARTEPYQSASGLVMLDFDAADNVIGIEFVGQMEFGIRELIQCVPVHVSESTLARTRYVSAKLKAA